MSEQKKPRRSVRVSLVIASLLGASGVIRLFDGTGAAIAREITSVTSEGPQVASIATPAQCLDMSGLEDVLAGLSDQRTTLDERAEQLDLREGDLRAASLALDKQMEELAAAEAQLRDLIAMVSTASENDVSQLTSVYENMKPKEAAALFEEMAPDFAAGFLARMRPEQAARILAGLQPSTAYSVSAILAGRNANAPTE